MHTSEEFQVNTSADKKISATLYSTEKRGKHLILICPAAAAPQHYYSTFAQYACEYPDFDVVTFDYQGINKSLKNTIETESACMSDWGERDIMSMIRWADQQYDKIFLLGHSVAGQIFPKASNHERILAAYFVGSQSAYMGHWKGIWKVYVWIFWRILIPVSTKLYGYLPGWTLGGNVNIGKKAALEWRKWGLHKNGVLQNNEILRKEFESVRIHAHFVSIFDDKLLAPRDATQALMHFYKNAITTFQHIKPKDLKLEKIGHFGFFKKELGKQLWPLPIMYFTQFITKFESDK